MAWTTSADTLFNFTFGDVGKFVYNTKLVDKLSESNRSNLVQSYQTQVGLTTVKTADYVDTYLKARSRGLPATLTPAPDLLPETQQLKDYLTNKVDAKLSQIGAAYKPDDLELEIKTARDKVVASLTKQHDADKKALISKITDEVAREKAVADLERTQAANLKAFENHINTKLTELHRSSQAERDRIATLGTMRELHASNAKLIDKIYFEKQADGLGAISSISGNSAFLQDVTVDDLVEVAQRTQWLMFGSSYLKAASGKSLMAQKTPDGGVSFTVSAWNAKLYHAGRDNKAFADDLTICQLLKSSGCTKITITKECKPLWGVVGAAFGYSNEKLMLESALNGIRAARIAGFEEANITVNVNGKNYPIEELYKKFPEYKPLIQSDAARAEQESGRSHLKKQSDAKKDVNDLRKSGQADPNKPAPGGPGNLPTQ